MSLPANNKVTSIFLGVAAISTVLFSVACGASPVEGEERANAASNVVTRKPSTFRPGVDSIADLMECSSTDVGAPEPYAPTCTQEVEDAPTCEVFHCTTQSAFCRLPSENAPAIGWHPRAFKLCPENDECLACDTRQRLERAHAKSNSDEPTETAPDQRYCDLSRIDRSQGTVTVFTSEDEVECIGGYYPCVISPDEEGRAFVERYSKRRPQNDEDSPKLYYACHG